MTTKKFYNKVFEADDPSEYGAADGPQRIELLRERTDKWLKSSGLEDRP